MIEIGAALTLVLIATLLFFGVVPAGLPIRGFELTWALAAATAGFLILGHWLYRHALSRHTGETGWIRTTALMGVTVTVLAALLLAPTGRMGAAAVRGFPVGYFLVAYGVPLGMFALFVLAARKQRRIDREDKASLPRSGYGGP